MRGAFLLMMGLERLLIKRRYCMNNSDRRLLIGVPEEKVIRQYEKKAEKESGKALSFPCCPIWRFLSA